MMIEQICHIGPALNVQGGISSVLVCYKKLFGLQDKHFITTYNGSFLKSLPVLLFVCLKLLFAPPQWVKCYQIHTSADGSFFRKFLVSLCLRLRRKKYTVHIHGSRMKQFCVESGSIRKKIILHYLKHAEKVIVITEDMKLFLEKYSFLKNVYCIIPNPCENIVDTPVDLNRNSPVRIVFSGRLGKRKGAYDLLDAFSKANFNVDVEMDFYGDGDVEEISKIIEQKNLKNVHVKGWILHDDYLKLLPNYDLLVLPSYAETFGMSLVEAMGMGIPVISTFSDAIPFVVENNVCGILNESGDISALTSSLEMLVNDKSLRIKMGKSAWSRAVSLFSKNGILEKLNKMYGGSL